MLVKYSKALPVRPWMEPEEPAMMEPMQRSARVGGRGRTSGTSMASLSTNGAGEKEWERRCGDGSWMRTFLCCLYSGFDWRRWTPASSSSSMSAGSWMRTGSVSSPYWSPMSPVSVQDDVSDSDDGRW